VLVRTDTMLSAVAIAVAGIAISAPSAAADCRGLDDADAVVCELNRVRDARGLDALRQDRRLERAGDAHARDMARRGYFSHVTPEGARLSDRLRGAGYLTGRVPWHVGETLAWGRGLMATPAATVAGWMRSAPHRRILLGRYREIGVGIAGGDPFGGTGTTYAADFGLLGG
jgi:uncharacterized protein YkwD